LAKILDLLVNGLKNKFLARHVPATILNCFGVSTEGNRQKLGHLIESLNLSGNLLQSLPESISNLSSLRVLDLSYNWIKAPPPND